MDVYARGTDGAVWKRTWIAPSWGGWNTLGGSLSGNPVALEFDEGSYHEMDIYVVGGNGHVWKIGYNGSKWGGWSDMGS